MITATLRYGTNRLPDVTLESGATVRTVRSIYGTTLRVPESSTAMANNVDVDEDYVIQNGDTITFEKQACKKA